MCYAAPTSAYEVIVSGHSGGAGHFLIPRLEVAINLEQKSSSYQKNLDKMLSWLAGGHWDLDFSHQGLIQDRGRTIIQFLYLM